METSLKEVTIATSFQFKNGFQSKNRFFKSAMSEQLADGNHNPTFGLQRLYKVWAEGGLGIIVSGNLMVDREHLGEPKNVVLDAFSDLQKFKAWTQAGSANGAKFWAQLNHPGKQAPKFIQPNPVAPSAIALEGGLQANFNKPRALQDSEIQSIIAKFAQSARLAKEVGFAGVQIHGAHGYLINQFLSARHNQRDDSWGGSIQNRMRFLLEIYNAVRQQVGSNFPVGVKLNSADFMRGGFTEAESMTVVQSLAEAGIDLIEISGGSYEAPAMADGVQQKNSTIKREAYFLEYAEKVRAL
ncbi:MAG: NADH:flavin oxidoreductase/NADH oxidase family protein, partial [Pseudomonadota bacterium]|nr:NADH:flavin oxidoreductase/NADH oxidase family protein [Pseudomonadota bacterium]